MNINELLNKKIIELTEEEMHYLIENATYGQMYTWITEEHERLRAMFTEIIYEINTMEMLDFIKRDDDEQK